MKRIISSVCMSLFVLVLTACGSGGGGGSGGGSDPVYTIGGTVSGLGASTNVVLQNNGGDSITLSANGAFTFPASVAKNGSYAVTVFTQPTGQICTVTNGTGNGVTSNVTNITVNCSALTYTISGSVSGLSSGSQVVLKNNSADPITISENNTFSFPTPVAYNGTYSVTVGTQPTGQTCTVSNASGTNVASNITGITVTCSVITYTVGGSISGLGSGLQVTLKNNNSDPSSYTGNGTFVFSVPVAYNGSYNVTIGTQPVGQTCVVSNGIGAGMTSNVTNVSVSCTTNTYTIGGTVSGLTSGQQVVLQNNGADPITLSSNTGFTMPTSVAYDGSYVISVRTQPTGQTCTITNATGTHVTSNAGNVTVNCSTNSYTIGGSVSGLSAGNQVTLQNNGGNTLPLTVNGAYTFSTPVSYNGTYNVTILTQPTGQTCTVNNSSGSNVSANVSNISVTCSTNTFSIGGTTSGLGSGLQLTVQNNGGDTSVITGNVFGAFPTPVAYGGTYSVTVSSQPIGQTCTVTNGSGTVYAAVTNIAVNCVNTSGKFVYATNFNGLSVSGYSLDNSTGGLTALPSSPTSTSYHPTYVFAHPNGKFLYVASSEVSSPVTAYSINATTGALTLIATYDNGGGSYGLVLDKQGRFVFLADADGYVVSYSINQTTGELNYVGRYAAGSTPVAITVDPKARYVFVLNQASNNISQYAINTSTGVLTFVANYTTGTTGLSITVDPTGWYLYTASVRNGHNVQSYSIDTSTGALYAGAGYGGSGTTDYVAFNPTGEFLYNVNAGNVIAYSKNASNGTLTLINTYPNGGTGGNAIVVDPLNKYAYVPNKGSNDVSILTINQSTGALTAGTPVAAGAYTTSVAIAIQQ